MVISGGDQSGTTSMTMGADGRMHMAVTRVPVAKFAEMLSRFVDKPVIDMTELKGNYRWINRSQEFRDSFGCARLLLKDRSLGRRSKTRRVFSNGNDALGNGVFKIIWSRTPLWLPCGVVYLRCIPTGGIESNVISSTEVRYTGRRKPTVDK